MNVVEAVDLHRTYERLSALDNLRYFAELWGRLFHGYGPLDDAWAEQVVDAALAGLRAV